MKWPGGKTKLLKHIIPLLPKEFGDFHEPFTGGGAVFFALWNMGKIKKAYLGDANRLPVDTYLSLRDHYNEVIARLKFHAEHNSQQYYYEVRDELNCMKVEGEASAIARAAAILYLNKTCFNGLMRMNKKGEFNAAWGHYENPKIVDELKLRAAQQAFQDADIFCEDFRMSLGRVLPGDFVYLDPPYVPASTSADFTEYTAEGFTTKDQTDLAKYAKWLAVMGAHVIVSNSDTPLVRSLYPEKLFDLIEVKVARTINVVPEKRGGVGELLIRTKTI